jgi:excisionase family DNA binding protein
MKEQHELDELSLLKVDEIARLLKLSTPAIYKLVQRKHFPKPIKLGHSARWRLADVKNWLKEKQEQSQSQSR